MAGRTQNHFVGAVAGSNLPKEYPCLSKQANSSVTTRVVRLLGEGGFGEGLACYHQEETGRPMLRFLARLSLGIAIGSALCLSAPLCEGSALAAGLTAKETAKAKQAKQL